MATALDVAAYIIHKRGSMAAMKLHKLVYYSQAWSLVWDEKPLFYDRIEAWVNGPVIRNLYPYHRGEYEVSRRHFKDGDASRLSKEQKHTVKVVLEAYGNQTPQWLSELTHKEDPWRKARIGLGPLDRGEAEISRESMYEYYDSILNSN